MSELNVERQTEEGDHGSDQLDISSHLKTDITSSTSQKKTKEGEDYSEVSPNKRYIRFNERYSNTANVKASYRGFDTKNGIEVVWQKIYLSQLREAEQEPIMRSLNYLKEIQQKHIIEYLSIWITEEPRTVNLITTYLDPLENFVSKVKTLRWRIFKKWCKQLLTGLNYLHTSSPVIVHRNLNLGNIFMDSGQGEIYLGGMWLSAVLAEGSDAVGMSELISTYCYQGRQPGSPAYKAPEVLTNQPLTTKVDIYSFGMCLLVLLTREDPYLEVYRAHTLDNSETVSEDISLETSTSAREKGYAAIGSLITSGVLPKALERVTQSDPDAGSFLRSCLALNPKDRKSAEELLNDPFLQNISKDSTDDSVVIKSVLSSPQHLPDEGTKHASADVQLSESVIPQTENIKANRTLLDDVSTSDTIISLPVPNESIPNVSKSPTKATSTVVSEAGARSLYTEAKKVSISMLETTSLTTENVGVMKASPSCLDESGTLKNIAGDNVKECVTINADSDDNHESSVSRSHPHLPDAGCIDVSVVAEQSSSLLDHSEEEKSSLVKEIAKLGTTDDVTMDRGIHDGRRAKSDPVGDIAKPSGEKSRTLNGPRQDNGENNDPNTLEIQLQIQGQYTNDGINKEVEFAFVRGSDKVEVVAAEMKDELDLNLSLDQLISLIRDKINHKSHENTKSCGSGSVPEQMNRSSPDSSCVKEGGSVPQRDFSPTVHTHMDSPGKESVIEGQSNQDCLKSTSNSSEGIEKPSIDSRHSNDNDTMVHSHTNSVEGSSSTLSVSISSDDDGRHLARDVSLSPDNEVDGTSMKDSSTIPLKHDSSTINSEVNLDITVNKVPSTSSSPNSSKTSLTQSTHTVPLPGEDATPSEIADYNAYLKEMEAIEKESRAARRVFEKRIQKHKIIQETCEDDLVKMEADLKVQQEKLSNKQIAAEKKRDEDLSQYRAELDRNLLKLKLAIDNRLQQAKSIYYLDGSVKQSIDTDNSHLPKSINESQSVIYSSQANGMSDSQVKVPSMENLSNAFANFDQSNIALSMTTSGTTTSDSTDVVSVTSPVTSNSQQHRQQQQPQQQSIQGYFPVLSTKTPSGESNSGGVKLPTEVNYNQNISGGRNNGYNNNGSIDHISGSNHVHNGGDESESSLTGVHTFHGLQYASDSNSNSGVYPGNIADTSSINSS